jgi:hypothetical protein
MRLRLRSPFLVSLLLCSLCVGASLSAAAPVAAQELLDDDRAHAHFVAGESHFAAERWSDASREFALAYEMSRRPEMLINLSRAHERGGELQAALTDLELLLKVHPETAYRGEAEQRMSAMRDKLARTPTPTPTPAPSPEATAAAVTAPTSVPAQGAPSERRTAPGGWRPSLPTIAIGGTGLVVGVVALGTGLVAHSLYKDLEHSCDSDSRCDPSFAADRDRGRTLARTSTALTFVSAALVGTAAVLWVYDVGRRRESPRLAFGIDGTGARMRAEF